jgi:hypothetical protein
MFVSTSPEFTARGNRHLRAHHRRGGVLVWCALLLVVLIGMVGLVIDGGLMLAGHRNIHNSADAAAMAAAMDLFKGKTAGEAVTTGTTFVTGSAYNNLAGASVAINIPPTTGPYAGNNNYAEAIVSHPSPSYFIHVLPGLTPGGLNVNGRAVAGSEVVAVGAGVMALNPDAAPGISITGGGDLCVDGAVFVNSNGGGEDEWGQTVGNGQSGAVVSNNATLCATEVYVAGGVNDISNFDGYPHEAEAYVDAGTGELYPDPLVSLPTPTTSNGVINADRGGPQATNGSLALNNPNDASVGGFGPNYVENPGTADETMVLHPGIYEQIKITGGKVRFVPGIYVIRPPDQGNVSVTLDITGGEVIAEGVMFYNTCSDYDPITGQPDASDGNAPPPSGFPTGRVNCGDIIINASTGFSPLEGGVFDGMLFYFRRWHTGRIQIEGNSENNDLTGTIYARWGEAQIAGQGVLNTQFLVGTMSVSGQGDVTVQVDNSSTVNVTKVFLVE